jgi:hypothetical protein
MHPPRGSPETSASANGPARATPAAWVKSAAAALIMSLLVLAVYVPLRSDPNNNTLVAVDYHQLHARRIRFAQEALFGEAHALPAWYPRELMGTPFWSNVQNFPFIPTRLALLGLDPLDLIVAGVWIAGVLSALFTFAFCRGAGMTRVGAASAGWTFACAGFFASRVMVGHLPLLEAYPALPLLLWRADAVLRQLERGGMRYALTLATLALAMMCVALAGHPQVPLYASLVTAAYVIVRGWRRNPSAVAHCAAAMALGAMCAAFALWPMLQLVRRSTRVLPLDDAANDIPFPYRRLLAFVFPWRDGWPESLLGVTGRPFTGYPSVVYFWDTVVYVGWAPLLAAAFLALRWAANRRRRRGETFPDLPAPAQPGSAAAPWGFFAVAGLLALVTALPAVQPIVDALPGTFVRSPARQLYVTTFCLALALGLATDVFVRRAAASGARQRGILIAAALALALTAHVVDLGRHARSFVRMQTVPRNTNPAMDRSLRAMAGTGRAGIDRTLLGPINRQIDDVGFFDSIMLAKPYAALMDLAGFPPDRNVQALSGSDLPRRALTATGTRFVMTATAERDDLKLVSGASPVRVYAVDDALPRATFLPASWVITADEPETHRRLRDASHDVGRHVMLPPNASIPRASLASAAAPAATTNQAGAGSAEYARPSSDDIVVRVRAAEPGVLRVLESWDPGWQATVNGKPADVLRADDVFLAVALNPGEHEVRFRFSTPGATTGLVLSLASAGLLACLLLFTWRAPRASAPHRAAS